MFQGKKGGEEAPSWMNYSCNGGGEGKGLHVIVHCPREEYKKKLAVFSQIVVRGEKKKGEKEEARAFAPTFNPVGKRGESLYQRPFSIVSFSSRERKKKKKKRGSTHPH